MSQYDKFDSIADITVWRHQFRARMMAERSFLLRQLYGVSGSMLVDAPVAGTWTAKDILVHIGLWDAFHTKRLDSVNSGRLSEIDDLNDETALNALNDQLYEQYKPVPLAQGIGLLLKERSGFWAMMNRFSDKALHQPIETASGWKSTPAAWAKWRYRHDQLHGQVLSEWRRQLPLEMVRQTGPHQMLRAQLRATRHEFLSLVDLVSIPEQLTRPVCGHWSLKDLVGHLTDWEQIGVIGLAQLADGNQPEFEITITDFNTFNEANAAVRKAQPWDQVWDDFINTRRHLLAAYDRLSQDQLATRFVTPWGPELSAYHWVVIWSGHEHEHAVDVRKALELAYPLHLMG